MNAPLKDRSYFPLPPSSGCRQHLHPNRRSPRAPSNSAHAATITVDTMPISVQMPTPIPRFDMRWRLAAAHAPALNSLRSEGLSHKSSHWFSSRIQVPVSQPPAMPLPMFGEDMGNSREIGKGIWNGIGIGWAWTGDEYVTSRYQWWLSRWHCQ